jgi:hypothetical protein
VSQETDESFKRKERNTEEKEGTKKIENREQEESAKE